MMLRTGGKIKINVVVPQGFLTVCIVGRGEYPLLSKSLGTFHGIGIAYLNLF